MKNLKNLFYVLVAAVLFAPAFTGCKKGAEDPSISLKSRDGRIKGTWALTAYEESSKRTYVNEYSYGGTDFTDNVTKTTTATYDGAKLKIVELTTTATTAKTGSTSVTTNSSSTETTDQAATLEITVEDQKVTSIMTYGAGTRDESYTSGSTTNTQKYTITGSRTENNAGTWAWVDSKKNKSFVSSNIDMFNGYLLKLAGKEMMIENDNSSSMTQSLTTSFTSGSTTYSNTETNPESDTYYSKATFEKK